MKFLSAAKKSIVGSVSFWNETLRDYVLKKVDNQYLNFSNILTIHGEDKRERCLFLGEDNTLPIWCLELSGEGTETVMMDDTIFAKIASKNGNRENCRFTIVYSKRQVEHRGSDSFFTKQSTYLFSYDKRFIREISEAFDIEIMETNKIVQAFYDLGMINKYYIDEKTLALKSRYHYTTLPKDELNNLHFKNIFAEGVYGALVENQDASKRNYKLFQGVCMDGEYLSQDPNLYNLYQEEWYGYIAMNVNLVKDEIEEYIKGANSMVQFGEKKEEVMREYSEAADHASKLSSVSAICNVVACLDNEEPINRLATMLNVIFIPKYTKEKEIIYGTPVAYKDGAYDFLPPLTSVNGWIKSIHKKHNIKSRTQKHMYGRDASHNFINYSWSESGDSLHWAIVAPTRSGKTFAILKIVQSTLGIKIVRKTDEEIKENERLAKEKGEPIITEKIISADKLGKTKIVHFDIGQSAFPFVTELKRAYPSQVHISQDNINAMRFGLLNIGYNEQTQKIDESDLLFSISIINLILSLSGGEGEEEGASGTISGAEEMEFRSAVQRVFEQDNYKGLSIAQLKEKGGYEEVIDKIYAFGEKNGIEITRHTHTTDIGLRGTELDYIQKPILSDVIKAVERKSKNYAQSAIEKGTTLSLLQKLKVIEKMPMFAYYDKSNIHQTDYYYQELRQLKDLSKKDFLPAYMITIQRLYRRDVDNAMRLKAKKLPIPDVIYILEEVHNLTKIKLLEKYFEVLTREASRNQIYFGMITQMPRDIPSSILANIGSRMVLASNRVTKNDLAYYWSNDLDDKDQIKKLTDFYHARRRKYLVFIQSGSGIVTIDQMVSKSEASLFNSNGQADLAEEIEEEVV